MLHTYHIPFINSVFCLKLHACFCELSQGSLLQTLISFIGTVQVQNNFAINNGQTVFSFDAYSLSLSVSKRFLMWSIVETTSQAVYFYLTVVYHKLWSRNNVSVVLRYIKCYQDWDTSFWLFYVQVCLSVKMAGTNTPILVPSHAMCFKNTAFSLIFEVLGFNTAMWVVAAN